MQNGSDLSTLGGGRGLLACALTGLVLAISGCGGLVEEEMPWELGEEYGQEYSGETGERGMFTHIACDGSPNAPDWYYRRLGVATRMMPKVPDKWGNRGNPQALAMARIARRESDYRIHVVSSAGPYVGMFQINRSYFPIGDCTFNCYWNGCRDKRGVFRRAAVWQNVAALRYILGRYGRPTAAWQHHCGYNWY